MLPRLLVCLSLAYALYAASPASAQAPEIRQGAAVPREIRECYDRALQFIAASQGENGDWPYQGHQGPAVTGLCLLTLLASGEDPNFGLYSLHVRKALRNMIESQDPTTGCIGPGNMYHHGFAMLALAETEAIELLLAAKRCNPNSGGGGGSAPGGGGAKDLPQQPALALLGSGTNEKARPDERDVPQSSGESGRTLPEEFREGLDEYFNRLEHRGER